MKIILYPLDKIVFEDNTEIKLGMSKNDVVAILGQGETYNDLRYYYHDSELAVDFSKDTGKVEFIEFLGGSEGNYQPEIYGVKAFQTDADELMQILAEKNDGDIDSEEDAVSYLEISVGIYRENYDERWETIGIGVKDYYC